MTDRTPSPVLAEWLAEVAKALDVDAAARVDVADLLDLAKVAATHVDRPAAPLTAFVAGFAAASRGGTPEAIAAAIEAAARLAETKEAST